MSQPLVRPWWRKKRWIAAILLWLVITYPTSVGPAAYLLRLGILPFPTFEIIYRPLFKLPESTWQAVYLDRWFGWWMSEAWLPVDGPNAL